MQRRPFLFTALALAGILPALAGAAGADQVNVKHTIDVESAKGRVLVHLAVANYGKQTIWIPREIAEGKELTGRRFDVRAFDNRPLDYTGKMVKRGAPTAADYQAVEPGKTLESTTDITRAYAFKAGRHTYNIGYAGPFLTDLKALGQLAESPAKPGTFIHTGQ